MDFIKYQYLLALAEERNFSRAAEKCYVSQPALTKCIQSFESSLGVKLFDRSSTPIRLTYAGERYIEGVKKLMAQKLELDREMEMIAATNRDRLTVGIPTSRAATWLPRILPKFWKESPNTEIVVVDGTSAALEQHVLKETADLAILVSPPVRLPNIASVSLCEEQLMFVLPPSMSVFDGTTLPEFEPNVLHYIDPWRLHGQPYVSFTKAQGMYYAAKEIFNRHGITPNTLIEIMNTTASYQLASHGLGFSVAPTVISLTELYEVTPVFCTLDDPPATRTLLATYKADRKLSETAVRFLDIAREAVEEAAVKSIPDFKVVYDLKFDA